MNSHGASSSSSSRPSNRNGTSNGHGNGTPYTHHDSHNDDDDDDDELDLLGDSPHHTPATDDDDDDNTLLQSDPLQPSLSSPLTFKKRKQKQPFRLLTALTGRALNPSHTTPSHPPPHPSNASAGPSTAHPLHTIPDTTGHSAKDPLPHDWYTEGPGRRVGYADHTAIDWPFEYTQERQRQRALRARAAHSPLLGYLARLLDASQVWVVLILSGLAVGALAAGIDVATDWLGDVKYGFCAEGVDGGRFYLGKTACCLGYDAGSQCRAWRRWGEVFGARSGAGVWGVEYGVYLVLAVVFAVAAGVLVREYAVYARHSGIPEIKTVLGGFVIRRFLGVQTLVTKSLGLVSSLLWVGWLVDGC